MHLRTMTEIRTLRPVWPASAYLGTLLIIISVHSRIPAGSSPGIRVMQTKVEYWVSIALLAF